VRGPWGILTSQHFPLGVLDVHLDHHGVVPRQLQLVADEGSDVDGPAARWEPAQNKGAPWGLLAHGPWQPQPFPLVVHQGSPPARLRHAPSKSVRRWWQRQGQWQGQGQ